MLIKALSNLLIFSLLCLKLIAQQAPYQAIRITENITLDGNLNEPDWQLAPVESEFMQTTPSSGAEPTEKTEMRILYNDEFIYFGITSYDTEPDKIIKVELERDFPIGNDDGVAVILDTYHDRITGLNFVTNLLDARWDAEVRNDGQNLSSSYNTFWDVKSSMQSYGYTTEFRIPISSLRFIAQKEVIMGVRIARLIKRKNELLTYPKCDPKTNEAWTNISFAREVVFQDLKSKNPLYISPYIIANYEAFNSLNDAGTAYEKETEFIHRKHFIENELADKIISNIGIDAKYGLTKNLTLDLTLNTDFAQAEVDDRIINLTKYEVNLPEKRSFFLESAGYLNFSFPSGNELFISRQIGKENGMIVPIIGGARLTGKINDWQIGMLNMQTTGIESEEIAPHNFTVFRTRKEFDSLGSFIGGIFTNRLNTDTSGTSYQSIGLDFVKRINQQIIVEGGVAHTMQDFATDNPLANSFIHTGIFNSANSGLLYTCGIDLVGSTFKPVVGYVDDNGYGFWVGNIGYQIQMPNKSSLEYINLYYENTYRWRTLSGDRETYTTFLWPGFIFKNGASIDFSIIEYKIDSLDEDWQIDENNAIAKGTYKTIMNTFVIESPSISKYSAFLEVNYGGFYSGKRFYLSPEASYYFTNHFNASLTYEYNHISFDTYLLDSLETIFISNLIRLNMNYNFSTKLSLKMYIQYDDLTDQLSSNVRFRFNPKEGTDLFLVINQGLNTDRTKLDPHLPAIENEAVTIKFIKTFGE